MHDQRLTCVLDGLGGKGRCVSSYEDCSPTLTKGRASINDGHLVCLTGSGAPDATSRQGKGEAFAVLDRCGNNWKNGKGGCGLLMEAEVCNTIATAFNPMLFINPAGGAER